MVVCACVYLGVGGVYGEFGFTKKRLMYADKGSLGDAVASFNNGPCVCVCVYVVTHVCA